MKIRHKQTDKELEIKYKEWVRLKTRSQFNIVQIEQLGTLWKQTAIHRINMGIYEESDAMVYVESDPTSFRFDKLPHSGLMVIDPNVSVYKNVPVVDEAFPEEKVKLDPWTIGGIMERFNINIEIKWWANFYKWYKAETAHQNLVIAILTVIGLILTALAIKYS